MNPLVIPFIALVFSFQRISDIRIVIPLLILLIISLSVFIYYLIKNLKGVGQL